MPSIIPRTALLERLSTAPSDAVIVIVAPPGSGKTVLLRSWTETLPAPVAWVSVDRNERDAQRFWLRVIDSVRAAADGQDVDLPGARPEFDLRATADRFFAQLELLDKPPVLIIDDLHELASQHAQAELETLIAKRPASIRIVLSTRHDLQLGLHRLRLAGELVEIRAADLRFSLDETRQLISATGVRVSDEATRQLHERTEGWPAGIRLAVLSVAGQSDPDRFIAEFSGSERTVAEYLLAEVLERQSDEVRELLLRTSIVDSLNASLADALTGRPGSSVVLEQLKRDNAFVEAAEDNGEWLRYHHLLGDLLRLALRQRHPQLVPELHTRASRWYEAHGLVVDAVRHAQSAEDWAGATRLLANHLLSLILDGQTSTVSALLDAFPPKERAAPELILVRAGVEIVRGSLDDAAGYLAVADREAEKVPVERRSAYDLESLVARLTLARRRGDLAGVHSAGAALPELSDVPTSGAVELNNDARAVALFELGIAELWTLNLADAKRHLDDGLSLARRINRPFLEVGCLGYLALIAGTKSLPRQRELATQAVAVADAHGWGTDPIVTMPLATLAIASAGQGRFDEGRQWLDRTRAALPPDAEPLAAMYADLADAVLLICERNFEAAADWLQDALAVETRLVMRSVIGRQVRQLLVIALIRLGRVDEARRWIAQFADDDRGSAEFGVALANLKLAEADARGALDALAGTLDGSATAIGDGTRIQAEMLAAIACDRLGDARAAQEHIERALDLAEPSTWVFPFLITDALDLIERQPRHATAHAALLADLIDLLSNGPGASLAPRADQPLEKLTDSELRVLRFLPSNLSAPEIAGELFLSTSTVKTHMRHIYDKLGTHKRTDAVQRARQLGLLAGTTRRT